MFISIIFVAIFLCVLGVNIYNNIITKKNFVKNCFSQIEVQLKRRYDLIPNLVESTKGYMVHEKETLESVIKARNQCLGFLELAKKTNQKQDLSNLFQTENSLLGALSKFQMISESYPQLKANENFKMLMEELSSTENRVAFSRQAYNDGVTDYNTFIQKFPNSVFAAFFNFQPASEFLITNSQEREVPVVKFG